MITMTVSTRAIPAKERELVQTLHELQTLVRREKGCCQYTVSPPNQHLHTVMLTEEWETPEDLGHYVDSEYFRVLLGALKILTETSELTISTASRSASLDVKRSNPAQEIYAWIKNVCPEWRDVPISQQKEDER